jgi:hypothetical protein
VIMRRWLGLLLIVLGCSSNVEVPGSAGAGAGGSPSSESGAAGASAEMAGRSSGGTKSSAGAGADAGAAIGGGGSAGGGASGGSGGEVADASGGADASTGGMPDGAGGEPAMGGAAGSPGGAASGGAGGEVADACDGYTHWSPTEKWTDYQQNDRRVFGGVLWRCQAPQFCVSYPGSSSSPGWFKVEDCAGGPTNEVAACQCASGTCCDGCYLRPRSHLCGEVVRTAQCVGDAAPECSGAKDGIDKDWWNLFCNGDSTECTRWGAHTKFTNGNCPTKTYCTEQGDQASCNACSN